MERTLSDPDLRLDPSSRDITDFCDADETVTYEPRDQSDLFEDFDGRGPEKRGATRVVRLTSSSNVILADAEVRGPHDGRCLLINIEDVGGSLDVLEGDVVIRVDSTQPVDISAFGAATVTVIVARGRSSMVDAHDASNVTVIAEAGARGMLRIKSEFADAEVISDSAQFRKATTWSWEI